MKKLLLILFLSLPLLLAGQDIGGDYYVAIYGDDSNPGSYEQPFATWQKAIDMAYPGDTIFVRGGVYHVTGTNFVEVNPLRWPSGKGRTGTRENPICFWAYPPDYESGNPPILDCSLLSGLNATNYSCFGLNAVEFWHIKGITVRNGYQGDAPSRRAQGFGASNSANITYENCVAHDITGRGFYFESGAWNRWDAEYANPENPPYATMVGDTTRWINCDAYNICDSLTNTSGDGWKTGNYFGGVMIFDGCRAWNYADDGIDPSGAGKRIFYNCWVASTDKYVGLNPGVEGNGIKTASVGEDQVGHIPLDYVFVETYNCIAADNLGMGFYFDLENEHQTNAIFYNNTAYRNGIGFARAFRGDDPTNESIFKNNIVYGSTAVTALPSPYECALGSRPYEHSNNTWIQKTGYPWFDYNPELMVEDTDFQSLDVNQLMRPRKPDGSLPDITFMRLAQGSDLIDAGVDVGLPYNGTAPDLGYSEHNKEDSRGLEITDYPTAPITDQLSVIFYSPQTTKIKATMENNSGVRFISIDYDATEGNNNKIDIELTGLPAGTYTVKLSDGTSTSSCNVTIRSGENNNVSFRLIKSFPNPTIGLFAIQFNYDRTNTIYVKVYGQTDNMVYSDSYEAKKNLNKYVLDMSPFEIGNYKIVLTDGESEISTIVTRQ